ncbi:class I SAM-dependent methyltransferase [Labrys wisconsinensis]|nr:methyltransferase domain-containing protein [Labrys wisconsinensis]
MAIPLPDSLHFLRAWAAAPGRVGAVAPSGRALAALITSEIGAGTGPVIELGPGTGVFTRALLARGVREEDLTLIEFGADFAELLQSRFAGARVLRLDASRLAEHRLFPDAPVGAVVSGLPLLTMPPRRVMAIMAGSFGYLRPGGAFYQFTYGPRCPIPRAILGRLGLRATLIGRAFRNIPPAAVYRITARPALRRGQGEPRAAEAA